MGKQSGLMWPSLLLVVSLLTGCDSQKQPAQAAYAQVEASIAPVREDLEKYAADEYEQLDSLVDQMKAKLNAKDYEGALRLQSQIKMQLIRASSAAAKKKNALATSMLTDWRVMVVSVPRMINQIKGRLSDLKGMSRLPANVTRDAVQRVQTSMSQVTADWDAAINASRRNNIATAVTQAESIKKRCAEFAVQLGANLSD